MDSDSQLLPAPRQQQQLQDPHTRYENLLLPPTASTSETPGRTRLPEHPLVAESSSPQSAIDASQESQTATTFATEIPTEARLNHSVSHSHLHLRLSDQQRHGHGPRNTHVRTHILRSHQSSSDLSTHRKERLLPRSAGSSNILRWASANNFQEQDTTKSDPRVANARQGDHAKGLKKDDGIPQWKKILTASKATRKHDRVEIDIIEALQTTQTSRKASTSTLREKGNFTNNRPQKEVGKKIIHGGIGRNGRVPFRSVKNTQADSGSRASSPSRFPFEPRLSICKDIERSLNSYLPMPVNDTNDTSIHEDKHNLMSEPAKSELGRLPDQANINAHQSASDRQDPPDTAVGNTCQETEGPALVVNHPSSGSNSVHDEPSTMETTTTSFQFNQFDCDEDFDTTNGQITHDANIVVVPFSESSEITPQLFDDLLPHMHSPFVARYAHFDGNFSGATDPHPALVAALPSRIIAEIASDCLMDYDLVSDFFLTFRGFMNSHTLLKILFARLEWALDRKTADGRIARIRTFAAIRHWVLNYFVDDFLHERDGWILRNEFCSHLNRLYRKMRTRMSVVNLQEPETRRGNRKTRPAAVASDLKLLIDLKRCWVGRCDLFCHPTNGLGDEINGVSNGIGDVFDPDRDIEPEFTPHDEKGAFCMQNNNAEANLRRLSRYTDLRFSHYGAFRPSDFTAPPPGTKPSSAASIDATSEPGDKSVNSPLDQIDVQAVVRDYHQQRQVGHVKTNSQRSVISFNSTASKGQSEIKRTFSDSVRIGVPTIRHSLSINNKPRPKSYNEVETTGRRQHKRDALTDVVRGDGQDGDVQREHAEDPNLSVPVSHDAQEQTPVISVAMQNTLAPAPPENLIRGTLFAPVEGIVHVLGDVGSADPSRNGPGTGDSQSPQYRRRSIQGHHENPRRPLMGGWGSKKDDFPSNVGGLSMSRDDVSAFNDDTPRTPVRGSGNHANSRLRSPVQSPDRNRPHAGELPKRSITLPVVTTPTDSPPHLNPLRGETYSNAGDQRPTHPHSAAQGVRHIMDTLRRTFVDRKHNHGDSQEVDWNSFDNCSSNGSTKGKSNWSGLPRGDTFASRFHLKRNASHMHHNSGGSQPSQTGRASLDKSRNWESRTSRKNSALLDRGQSPVSHFNNSYIPSEADTSVLSNASPAVKTPSTSRKVAINDPMHSSNHETHGSASDEKPQIQHNISLQESAERKGSLDQGAREEALVLLWLKKNKEARLDLLAESAAESYMDRITEFSGLERQNRASTATIFTPDVTTHSIQIRMARANERNSDCISAEVKRAMAKMAASSTSEPDQPPPNQSSSGSPGSPMSHPRSQSLSHEEGHPQALITHVLPGDYTSMGVATATVFRNPNYRTTEQTLYAGLGFGLDLASRIPRRPSGNENSFEGTPHLHAASGDHITRSKSVSSRQSPCHSSMGAATATVFRNPNYRTTEQTLYAGLGFGLDLASRIPRRPSGNGNSFEGTPHLRAASGDHITRSKSVSSRQSPCHSSSPAPYQGPDLAIVESAPPSGRNSSDTQRNHDRVSLTQRKLLEPKSLGEGDVNSTEVKEEDMERSVTRLTQGTQVSQSTDHSPPDSLPENGHPSERAGAVARSMRSWSNRLRKYASYQSGMSKLNFRRHHEHEDRADDAGEQRHGEGGRERSFWAKNKHFLPHHHHHHHHPHQLADHTPGQVSHHQPLNVSSLNVHEKIDEHDKEITASLTPLLTLPSSTLQLSLPSPYLFENRENVHQSSSEKLSPQISRQSPGSDMGDAVTHRPNSSGVDTTKATPDESPYLAADFTWRRVGLVDSLSKSQTSGRMCSVDSGKAEGVQPGAVPNSHASHESQVSAQSSADHDLATFGPSSSTSPDAEASPLKPEEGWEQVSVNISPSKPTFFPQYSLHNSDSQDCEISTTIFNDSEANNGSARPVSPSTTSSIGSKATIPTSPNDDGQASDDLLSSNDSELSYHSARQDVNAIQSEDSVDTVSVSSNLERKTLRGQDKTSVCHSRQFEPSIKEYSCREPYGTPSSSTDNTQHGIIARNETPNTVAPPRPSSTHDEVLVANQVGENQKEQPQMPVSGSHASTSHPPPVPQVSLPLSTYQHAPFILAYNSKVLVEQFTIIEVAALAEIDWRDLVDMNWSNDQNTLDWAGYLTSEERRGIDVVIARFNLMVKWIVSEIVLTHDISERAGAISKFIHIAVQARRMRNFSTMVQITIALSSVDCVSLKNTWALVDSDSRNALEEMEVLVQPLRNFKDLRMEMESQGLHEGCVPFVGLYVQDLTYNAQKPPTIHVEGGAQPLVNLERYRTAASIIKSLLRLIEASTRYDFTPVNGVIERCLWISCLKDEDIRLLSKSAEL